MTLPNEPIDLGRYYLRDSIFDHPSEYEFYKILRDEILGSRFVAMVQIPLSALIDVGRRKEAGWSSLFGRIARKRIDFLICERDSLKPRLVIELDGSTHSKAKRIARDELLESIFESVAMPLLRIPLQSDYDRRQITLQIAAKLGLGKRKQ